MQGPYHTWYPSATARGTPADLLPGTLVLSGYSGSLGRRDCFLSLVYRSWPRLLGELPRCHPMPAFRISS